jgi:hypothetical protein
MNNNNQWYSLLKKIEECMQDANYLNDSNKSIPMIEIDLAMEKLSTIYNTLFELKIKTFANEETGFLSKSSSIISEIVTKTVFSDKKNLPSFAKVEEKPAVKENNSETIEPKVEAQKPEIKPTVKVQQEMIEFKQEIAENPQPVIPAKEEEKKVEEKITKSPDEKSETPAKSLTDALNNEEKKTIGDRMASLYKKHDISSLQQMKPIKDLKQVISINDKIMFIRMLFNNNVDDYNSVVHQINTSANLDDALTILDNKLTVDSENEVMQSFLELIYRRFIS